MPRTTPTLIALLLVVAAGVVHGRWTHRWTASHAIEHAAAKLEGLPTTLGDWHGQAIEIDRNQLALAGIAGYVARRYEDRLNQNAVTILLVCGRPGPISVHTPDVCYAAAGYEPLRSPTVLSLPIGSADRPAVFRDVLMGKPGAPLPSYLRILWSWSATGRWEAPEYPRLRFAPSEVLYKLYVIRELTTADERTDDDPALDFLGLLIPEMDRIVYAGAGKAGAINEEVASASRPAANPRDP